jgi:hypothetical protein
MLLICQHPWARYLFHTRSIRRYSRTVKNAMTKAPARLQNLAKIGHIRPVKAVTLK